VYPEFVTVAIPESAFSVADVAFQIVLRVSAAAGVLTAVVAEHSIAAALLAGFPEHLAASTTTDKGRWFKCNLKTVSSILKISGGGITIH
jgi:hypothetical protein